jgi:CheY-like chemotaxis protein
LHLLRGKKILCVEDEPLIAMTLVSFLEDFGCEIIGPAYTAEQGLGFVHRAVDIDAAVLDVNLGRGTTSAVIADMLRRRQVPFFFATGYDGDALGDVDRRVLRLPKPYTQDQLYSTLNGVVQAKRSPMTS